MGQPSAKVAVQKHVKQLLGAEISEYTIPVFYRKARQYTKWEKKLDVIVKILEASCEH